MQLCARAGQPPYHVVWRTRAACNRSHQQFSFTGNKYRVRSLIRKPAMSQQQYYRTLVDLHREVPVFFRPWWLDIVCHTWDVALVEQDGQITGIMPYQVEKKAGIRLLRNPPLTPYQGPWIRPAQDMEPYKLWNREEDIFNRLWAQIPAFDSYDIMTMPGFQNFLLFHAKGFDNNIR